MSERQATPASPSFVAWVRDALRVPLASNAEYFDRLNADIRSSAPVLCAPCRS